MNTPAPHKTDGQSLLPLCQTLIAREEHELQAILAALRQIRPMLASGTPEALTGALANAMATAAALSEVRARRDQFRHRAARLLGVEPAAVTLRVVAQYLPADAAILVLNGRDRLQRLATEITQINHGNAIIIWWCLDFAQQVFAALQGNRQCTRYGAAGKVQPIACGPIWQGQG